MCCGAKVECHCATAGGWIAADVAVEVLALGTCREKYDNIKWNQMFSWQFMYEAAENVSQWKKKIESFSLPFLKA